jgi:cell wall-associated NlpC family hydrolase
MPTRLRSLLPPIAFAAIVLGLAAFAALPTTAPAGSPGARTAVETPEPRAHRLALRRAVPRPSLGRRAAKIALRAVGVPYRWGGASPASGFDCSGLVYWAYSRLGVELAHSSYALYGLGRRVPRSKIEPGDLLFFYGLGHVGVYVGRGRMVHAPQSGRRVEVVELRRSYYGRSLVGARRMIRT